MIAKINLGALELTSWPFDEIRRLHRQGPVAIEPTGTKVFLSYDAVRQILTEKSFDAYKHNLWLRALSDRSNGELAALARVVSSLIVYLDPPVHTRIRRGLQKLFTRARIDADRHIIESIALEEAREIYAKHSFDLVADYSARVPTRFIAHLMDIPDDDIFFIKRLSDRLVKVMYAGFSLSVYRKLNEVAAEFESYFLSLIEKRRGSMGDDLISKLVRLRESGEFSEDSEMISACLFLFVAGQETTVKAVGNAVYLLLKFPDQLALLRERPDLIKRATNEFLRFAPSVSIVERTAREDTRVAGVDLRAGESVLAYLTAASHDPEVYSQPELLDIKRSEAPLLSFGSGIHTCVGAYLANLEIQISINTLLSTLPDFHLKQPDAVQWGTDVITYGPTRLYLQQGTS